MCWKLLLGLSKSLDNVIHLSSFCLTGILLQRWSSCTRGSIVWPLFGLRTLLWARPGASIAYDSNGVKCPLVLLRAHHCCLMELVFALLAFGFMPVCLWRWHAFDRCFNVPWVEHAGTAAISIISSSTKCHILTIRLLVRFLIQLREVPTISILLRLLCELSS